MSAYSIVILICSTALSHTDCRPDTALDVVRGPSVDNIVMCSLNAQTVIARTDLLRGDNSQYMKAICAPSKSADQWKGEIEARKSAANPNLQPGWVVDRNRITYFAGVAPAPAISSQDIRNRSHVITAFVDQPGEGVLIAAGGAEGGYALFVKEGKPTYEFNSFGQKHHRVTSSEPLAAGKSVIRLAFKYDGDGSSKGGDVTMFMKGKKVAMGRVEMATYSSGEALDIGLDGGTPVSDLYASPFKFTGTIGKIEVSLDAEE